MSIDLTNFSQGYVNLRYQFMAEEDRTYLQENLPEFNKFNKIGCPTCGGTQKYQWRGEIRDCDCKNQLALYNHYADANIGLNYQRLDWTDYDQDTPAIDIAVQGYLNMHENMVRNGMGTLMHGPVGRGKTMLSLLIAKELVKLGYTVYCATFAEMISQFTKGWNSIEDRAYYERKIINSNVFVLDDVGKEFKTKNNLAESTFDAVMRQRVNNCRPILLTTNMTQKELQQGYGAPIFSLLSEKSVMIETPGSDYRPQSRDRSLVEAQNGDVRPIF